MVLRYPRFTAHHPPGSITHAFATVMDIMPTLLSLAGISHPNSKLDSATTKAPWRQYQVYPVRGKDWGPFLLEGHKASRNVESLAEETMLLVGRRKLFITPGEDEAIWGSDSDAVGWEMGGKAGVRKGKWKILNLTPNFWGTDNWQL